MTLYHNKKICQRGARCKDFRNCEFCCRVRQKKIADVAESGARQSRYVSYAVIRTYDQQKIKEQKAKFMPKLKQLTQGGLWTIEHGEYSGLHLNIIAGSERIITATDVAKAWGYRGDADIHLENVPHNEVRYPAAYSAKFESIPTKEQYSGHTYGTFGTFKRPLGILATQTSNPWLQILAIEQLLTDAGIADEYANKGDFSRACAVASEKVNSDGFYLLNNYGLITKDDLTSYLGREPTEPPPPPEKQDDEIKRWFDPVKKEWYEGERRVYDDYEPPKAATGESVPAPEWFSEMVDSVLGDKSKK